MNMTAAVRRSLHADVGAWSIWPLVLRATLAAGLSLGLGVGGGVDAASVPFSFAAMLPVIFSDCVALAEALGDPPEL